MTIRHMRIFAQVYQDENVTRAAERLHMTQPAVSRAIQELEKYYGVRLFERLNKRLYRTPCADEMFSRARHLIDLFDEMETGVKNWDEFGVLRIGGSITVGNFILPGLTASFQKKHPNLKIQVRIANAEIIQQAVLNNELDIAIVEGGISSPLFQREVLFHDHLRLILPVDHPLCAFDEVPFDELTKYPLLMREKGSAGRIFLENVFALRGYPLEPIWESTSTLALFQAVKAGIGVAILPERLVEAQMLAGTFAVRPVADEAFTRSTEIIWHRQKYLSKTAQDWIRSCRGYAASPES